MVTEFHPTHLAELIKTPFAPQAPYGRPPAAWAKSMHIEASPELPDFAALPTHVLTREEVRQHCQAPYSVLHGYMVAMAWGAQGAGPGGTKHALTAWAARQTIAELLTELRRGELSRAASYDLFARNPVPGLGPAYFSKLIYYFRSGAEHGQPVDRYVADQWVAKSINLLTGERIIRMTGDSPSSANTGVNYEAFCSEIDRLAETLSAMPELGHKHSGEDVDQMLFSLGSFARKPQHPWRLYVDTVWSTAKPTHAYDEGRLTGRAIQRD